MKRRLTAAGVVVLAVMAAAPAWGTIGSVISSFSIDASHDNGILAQGNRLYLSGRPYSTNYIYTYNHTGTILQSRAIDPGNSENLYSGSRTHLGNGYIGLVDSSADHFKVFSIADGGTPVASFPVLNGPHNVFWTGEHYYINTKGDLNWFRRYTSTGGNGGTWTCAGWPSSMALYCSGVAYAQRGNYAAGPYFVASSDYRNTAPCCMTTFPAGSLVSTWQTTTPSEWETHLSYGDSSNPGTYGAAVWAIFRSYTYVVEFDIDARNASSIMPASVGKIKAIYR